MLGNEPTKLDEQFTLIIRCSFILAVVLGDLLLIFSAAWIATFLRFDDIEIGAVVNIFTPIIIPFSAACLVFKAHSIDCLKSGVCSCHRAVVALIIGLAAALIIAYSFKASESYSRLQSGYFLISAVCILVLWRFIIAKILDNGWLRYFAPSIIIIGDNISLNDIRELGSDARFLDVTKKGWIRHSVEPAMLDRIASEVSGYDRLLLSFSDPEVRKEWVSIMRLIGGNAEVIEPGLLYGETMGLSEWSGRSTVVISRGPLNYYERVLKRIFDLFFVILSLPIVFLPILIAAILVKISSPGPVLFVQKRIGKDNKQFNVFKFRTMKHTLADPAGRRSASLVDDRLTPVGRFLRRTSIDELPQLFNVLIGNMSLVGPRPHAVRSRAGGRLFWEAAYNYWDRHHVLPGITGLAQIRGFRGGEIDEIDLQKRVDSDIEYLNKWNVYLDLIILIKTVYVVIFGKNAY